jgi:methyl-accepting chemotaxis protein
MATALAHGNLDPRPISSVGEAGVGDLPAKLFRRTFSLGLDLADASGSLSEATDILETKAQTVAGALANVDQTAKDIVRISQKLSTSAAGAESVRRRIEGAVDGMQRRVAETRERTHALSQSAERIGGQLDAASVQLKALGAASATIQNIAREIQLLAVNAGVEAARHGAAGRGFAVIAEAVKKLADQTRHSTAEIERHQSSLASTIVAVQNAGVDNLQSVVEVDSDSHELSLGVAGLSDAVRGVTSILADNADAARILDTASGRCVDVVHKLRGAASQVVVISEKLDGDAARFNKMVDAIEAANSELIESGAFLPISALSDLCRRSAEHVASEMRQAISGGELSRTQLFDTNYMPIPGTNPQQYETAFCRFADRALARYLDEVKASDKRITFCAAVDRNGYLPTHNSMFSKPQGPDPEWNLRHCRNRRIFDDRTGLRSARNTKAILLQTYRRDLGGGAFEMIGELAAPIVVDGAHWGAFRLGFTA